MLQHLALHGGVFHIRSAHLEIAAADHQHLVERDFTAHVDAELFHNNLAAFFDAELLSARLDNCVHEKPPKKRKE